MTRMGDTCPTCGQPMPDAPAYLTPRELDVLTCWWLTDSVKRAAGMARVGEQRAKNLLSRARIRNHARTNYDLLTMHFADVRVAALARMQHNSGVEEAA